MEAKNIIDLATKAVAEYRAQADHMGAKNAILFPKWIEKAADSIPEIALDKKARKLFVRKALEIFAR